MVTSDQRSLDSGQKGSVIAEKAYEGFRKGLLEGLAGGGEGHICLHTFSEDAFGDGSRAGWTSGESWCGRTRG